MPTIAAEPAFWTHLTQSIVLVSSKFSKYQSAAVLRRCNFQLWLVAIFPPQRLSVVPVFRINASSLGKLPPYTNGFMGCRSLKMLTVIVGASVALLCACAGVDNAIGKTSMDISSGIVRRQNDDAIEDEFIVFLNAP